MSYYGNPPRNGKWPHIIPRQPPWRIAIIANLSGGTDTEQEPGERPQFENRQSTAARMIARALEVDGHWVHICPADDTLPEALLNLQPHICFNIASQLTGNAPEAQVPALCELLGFPYTASRVAAAALHKGQIRRIWRDAGLPVPRFQLFPTTTTARHPALQFPLVVKPINGIGGAGVEVPSIVEDEASLREQIHHFLTRHHQPALVEEYLPGREFTVAFIGNPRQGSGRRRPSLYDPAGYHLFPVMEIDTEASVTPGVHSRAVRKLSAHSSPIVYHCPAAIDDALRIRLLRLAVQAAETAGVCDFARVDFRLNGAGEPCLVDLNVIPMLDPVNDPLCLMAEAEDLPYASLVGEILYLAAERWEIPFGPAEGEIRSGPTSSLLGELMH